MRSRLFTVLSVVSLLLCVGTVVLWIRSYHVPEGWSLTATRRYIAQSASGLLEFDVERKVSDHLEGTPDNYDLFIPIVLREGHPQAFCSTPEWSYEGAVPMSLFGAGGLVSGFPVHASNRAGFGWGEDPVPLDTEPDPLQVGECVMSVAVTRYLVIPHWFLFALTAVFPLVRGGLWMVGRLRRRGPGLCAACEYNLTGNTSGVCPECGTAITTQSGHDAPPTTSA